MTGSRASNCPPAPCLPILGPPTLARRHRTTGTRGPVGPFTVAAGAAGTQGRPFLTSIEVAPQADGWQISLIEAANALTFPVGTGAWTVSDHTDRNGETIPVAASGGWLDGQRMRAEVIFLETPHRMDITCSLPGRTAEAAWRHPPLTPSRLQLLHCPG